MEDKIMATYIENIVIGKPIVDESVMFASDIDDWNNNEKEKTLWTDKRNFAAILKDLGVVDSISEVRRNKPNLCVPMNNLDFIEIKWGKRKFFVLVGE
jgi:hypothetical protein